MTLTEYYNDLVTLNVSGVNSLNYVPTQVTTAILPCKYVRWTNSQIAVASLSQTNGLPTYTFDVVFLIESVGQNTTPVNQALAMTIANAIETYAENVTDFLSIDLNFEINVVSNNPYWGLIATITVLGG